MYLSVREDISGTTRAIFTKFLCVLPMSVARFSSGILTIGRIACRQEGVTGVHSAGVIYTIGLFVLWLARQSAARGQLVAQVTTVDTASACV